MRVRIQTTPTGGGGGGGGGEGGGLLHEGSSYQFFYLEINDNL